MSLVSSCTVVGELCDLICHIALEEPLNRIAIQYHDGTPDGIQKYVNARLAFEFEKLPITQPQFDHGICFTSTADHESLIAQASRTVLGVYWDCGVPRPAVSSKVAKGHEDLLEELVSRFCNYVAQVWIIGISFETA